MEAILHRLGAPRYCNSLGIRYMRWCKSRSIHTSYKVSSIRSAPKLQVWLHNVGCNEDKYIYKFQKLWLC